MNNRPGQQKLLHDVLAESAAPDFRETLLGETLRQARRRRRWRQSRSSAGVLAVLLLSAWLLRHNRVEKPQAAASPKSVPVQNSYRLVATEALPASAFVKTDEFTASKTISSKTSVVEVATRSDGFRYLNDNELLAKLAPGTAILVRTGPNTEELVFSEPANVSTARPEN
jgi:hypothetical protein